MRIASASVMEMHIPNLYRCAGQNSGCKEQGRETSGAMARDTDSEELKAWLSAARCRLHILMAVDMNRCLKHFPCSSRGEPQATIAVGLCPDPPRLCIVLLSFLRQPVSAKDKNYGRLDQSLEQEQQLLLDDQLREPSRRGGGTGAMVCSFYSVGISRQKSRAVALRNVFVRLRVHSPHKSSKQNVQSGQMADNGRTRMYLFDDLSLNLLPRPLLQMVIYFSSQDAAKRLA
ncbi:hypothetical protein NQZ68_015956 [Dissostichus eleginoides]|nr:hypothetical protein NQZ68_015956 [Dissostichus eleginoides]